MELTEIREALGPDQPAYRASQVYNAIYHQRVGDLVQISTLPVALRRTLADAHSLGLPELDRRFDSTDGTRRYLLRLEDGRTVETVWMPEESRDTICISSQVGCPVDCKFCMTALMGLERNLTAGEIVGQVLFAARDNGWLGEKSRLNIVLMGMGEPLLNLPSRVESHAHPDRCGRRRAVGAAHHAFHRRPDSADCGAGARAGAAETGCVAERVDRRDAAGAHADHA